MQQTIVKLDWINNMDHVCISDIEPSSEIIRQTNYLMKDGNLMSKWCQNLNPRQWS